MLKTLLKNNINKDVTDNLVNSLDAIQYLSTISPKEYTDLINVELPNTRKVVKYNIVELPNTRKVVKYNIFDMLVTILYSNTRRIYPHIKTKSKSKYRTINQMDYGFDIKKPTYELKDLNDQQNNIYKIFNLLKENLNTNSKEGYYKIFNNEEKVDSLSMFCYLSLHQSLTEVNQEKHKELLSYFYKDKKIDSSIVLGRMKEVVLKREQKEILKYLFNYMELDVILSSLSKINLSWQITALEYLYTQELNLSYQQKYVILSIFKESDLLSKDIFKSFSDISESEFKSGFKKLIFNNEKETNKLIESLFGKLDVDYLYKKTTYKFLLENVTEFKHTNLLINIFINNKLTENEKEYLYKNYNITNETIKEVLRLKKENNISIHIPSMIPIMHEKVSKEILSLMLVDNPNDIEYLSKIIQNIKLNENLLVDKKNDIKKIKI